MPIYMDRHDLPGITAKDVAAAHQADLRVQDTFGCKGLTYWFDKEKEIAFCLVEAPDSAAVNAMHEAAHGMMPYKIIEVDGRLVESFLGRIEDPPPSEAGTDTPVILNDPAFRAILATGLKYSEVLQLGVKRGIDPIIIHKEHIRKVIKQYGGREADHREDCFLASFTSVSQAMLCAMEIQMNSLEFNSTSISKILPVQMGLSAGVPVSDSNEFFGQTIQLARQLCELSGRGQLTVSSEVWEQCRKDGFELIENHEFISPLSPPEEIFVRQLMDLLETSWDKDHFTIRDLAREMGVSKSQMYRKINALTGLSPNDFLQGFRLDRALNWIGKKKGNISEIAYRSGFNSPSYFSKCFKKRFGLLPSQYAASLTNLSVS